MRITFQHGRELGRLFVKEFPGVRDILKGIRDIFNPEQTRKALSQVVRAFGDFFKAITVNPETGLKNLYQRLQEIFFGNFSAKTSAGRQVIEGFSTFFRTMFRVGIAAITLSLRQISELVSSAFTKGTAVNNFVMGAYKMLQRLGQTIIDFPWRNTINSLKESLLEWFVETTDSIDWNVVAENATNLLIDGFAFSLRALATLGSVILKALSEIDFATGMRLFGVVALAGFLTWLKVTLPPLLLEAGTVLVMDFLLPGILTGLEMAGSAIFTAIGGWPTLIVGALAAAGVALLEWGDDLMDSAAVALDNFGPMFASAIEEYLPVILEGLWDFFEDLPSMFVRAVNWIGGAIKSSVEWLIESVSNLFSSGRTLDNSLTRFLDRIGQAIGNVFDNFLETHFPRLHEGIHTTINFFRGLGVIAGKALAAILTWRDRYITPVVDNIREMMTSIKNAFTTAFDYVSSRFQQFVTSMQSAWGEISASIQPVVDTIRSFLDIQVTGVSEGGGFFGEMRKSFQDIVSLGEQSQAATAATTQQTAAAIATSTKQASAAVKTTSDQSAAALAQTAQQAAATGAQIAQATKQGAASAVTAPPGGGGDFFSGLFGGGRGGATPESVARREALEEIGSLRVPSRSQMARLERDVQYVTDRYSKGIVNNIRDLVASVNTVTTELNSIGDSPQRINVQLKQLANNLGVGGAQRLEIRNRNFTIQMNVNVTLDADEFEQALSSRPGGSTFVVRPENE